MTLDLTSHAPDRRGSPARLVSVSNLPISSKYVSAPAVPVDAGERDAVVNRLNAAFEAGQIDDLDYRRYLDIAFSARTLGDLRPVVERLPAQVTYATPGIIVDGRTPPGELAEARKPDVKMVLVAAGFLVAAVVFVLILLFVF